ncbi:heterogeneous nuclear ribonucleoprotein H2-like [Haliotis asinina]|uniref:heterogeneous nuclear ribonucleoprotein H2-like n=1 Tax=Haliotis asinina TaxID=109174 RepID=UPI003531A281
MKSTVIVALCLVAITTCDAFLGLRRPAMLPGMLRPRLGMGRMRGSYGYDHGYDNGYDGGFDGGYDGYDNGYRRIGGRRPYGGYGNDDFGRDSPDFLDYGRMRRRGYY